MKEKTAEEKQHLRLALEWLVAVAVVVVAAAVYLPPLWLICIGCWGSIPSVRNFYRWAWNRGDRGDWTFHPSYFEVAFIALLTFGAMGAILAYSVYR